MREWANADDCYRVATAPFRITSLRAQATLPQGYLQPLVAKGSLSEAQLARLAEVQRALHSDYRMRREMQVQRVGCTLSALLAAVRVTPTETFPHHLLPLAQHTSAGATEDDLLCWETSGGRSLQGAVPCS